MGGPKNVDHLLAATFEVGGVKGVAYLKALRATLDAIVVVGWLGWTNLPS